MPFPPILFEKLGEESGARDSVVVFYSFAGLWLLVGGGAFFRQLWAVRAGLAINYIVAVGSLVVVSFLPPEGFFCGLSWLVCLLAGICLSHLVLGHAAALRDAGVSLTARRRPRPRY